jgi:AraC-like DNA-binding protein
MPHTTEEFGFKYHKIAEGQTYHSEYETHNQLFFLLEGKMLLQSSEVLGQVVGEGEFFFLPISADMSCRAMSPCSCVIFFFNRLKNSCERNYFRELWNLCAEKEYQFQTVAMKPFLSQFIGDITKYFKQMEGVTDYYQVKYEELLYLLRSIYAREEMARIFHPIVGRSLDFRRFILENYLKIRNIHGLVRLSGLKRKTFDRQFNDEFGETPYQWLLRQKAKHIRYALSETNDQMQEIMKKYGFVIAPHFTRFCKEYFECTPLELRKRLRMEKSQVRH